MNRKRAGNKNAIACDKYVRSCFDRGSSYCWQVLIKNGLKSSEKGLLEITLEVSF